MNSLAWLLSRKLRLIVVVAAWIASIGATTILQAEDVLTVFLKQPSAEQFPCEKWCPQQRPEIATELATMNELLQSLATLDKSKRNQIKKCYDDRAALVREIDVPAMKQRLKSLCTQHKAILSTVRKIRWAETPTSAVRFTFEDASSDIKFRTWCI